VYLLGKLTARETGTSKTRQHGKGPAGVRTYVRTFPLAEANEALIALKQDAIRGAAVLVV
jgi:hypothetical protein